jgi:hypothetical protein
MHPHLINFLLFYYNRRQPGTTNLLFSMSRTANFVVRVRTTNGRTGAPCIDGRARIHATNPASVMELWNEINSIVTNQLLA